MLGRGGDAIGAEEAAGIVHRQRQRTAAQQEYCVPTSSLPHQGRRIWLSVGCRALEGVVDADMVLQVGADIGVGVDHGDAERCEATAAGPMPESCRSCGELTEPPQMITSRPARRALRVPAVAAGIRRRPRACPRTGSLSPAPSSRRGRFGRFIAGRRKARAADMRRPSLGGDLVDADAFLGGAVEIRIERQAGLLAGLQIARASADGRRRSNR